MDIGYYDFRGFFCYLSLVSLAIVLGGLLVWMIWLVVIKYPREEREEEALKKRFKNASNQKFSFWDSQK